MSTWNALRLWIVGSVIILAIVTLIVGCDVAPPAEAQEIEACPRVARLPGALGVPVYMCRFELGTVCYVTSQGGISCIR